jgi:hypothetical protein
LLNVIGIYPAMVPARLPRRAGVVAEFFLLNPHDGLGEEIDSAHVVPVRVADDNVRDFFRVHSSKFHGLAGPEVVLDGPFFKPALAVKAAVEKDIASAAADQPKGVDGVDFFVLGSTHDHVRDGIARRVGEAYGLNGVVGRRRRSKQDRERSGEQKSIHNVLSLLFGRISHRERHTGQLIAS